MSVGGVEILRTIDDVVSAMAEPTPTRVIAGGTALVPAMRAERLPHGTRLVYVGAIGELKRIELTARSVSIGAAVRLATLEHDEALMGEVPALATCLSALATPRIRNMATIGGALAQRDPGYDLPVVLAALEARVRVLDDGVERLLSVEELTDSSGTGLSSTSVLTEVLVPLRTGRRSAFVKLSPRTATDRAVLAVAVRLDVDGTSGRVAAARIVLGGLGRCLVRAVEAEGLLQGTEPGAVADLLVGLEEAVGRAVAAHGQLPSDVRASGAYRGRVAPVVVRRCVLAAAES